MRDLNTPYITDQEELAILEADMKGKLKYTLMNDFLAKYTLQNDLYALKGLLAALLDVELDEITDIEILNPVEVNEAINDKKCILDVNLELNCETIINIEIQTVYQSFWPERSLTYLSRNFDQLKAGEYYDKVKPCVQIGILQKEIFPDHRVYEKGKIKYKKDPRYTGKFYSTYRMLEVESHTEYSSKFEIRVLSLNHVEEVPEIDRCNHNGLYYWAKLFTAESWEELKMVANENSRMKSFVGTVRKLSAEEKVANACEARRRYSIDLASFEWQLQQAQKEVEEEKQRVEEEKQRADEAKQQAEEEKQRADEAKQQADAEKQRADEAKQQAEEEKQRAEEEKQRADEAKQQADEAKQQADEAKQQADEAKQQADAEKQRADLAEKMIEEQRKRIEELSRMLEEKQ